MIDVKKLLKKYVRDPYRNHKGVFRYYEQQLFFPKDSLLFQRAMNEGGVYERENIELIQLFLRPGTTLFDIGANIGMISVPLLWNNRSIDIISVEASPNSLSFLQRTREASSFQNRWTIVGKAVAEKAGTVDFFLSTINNGAFDGLRNTQRVKVVNTVSVECTTIDHVWQESGQPEVSFLKCDIEGADLLAMKGARQCIDTCRPVMLIEWNQENIQPFELTNADLIAFLTSINYEIFVLPEIRRIANLVELNLICKTKFVENFLLIPAEKKD